MDSTDMLTKIFTAQQELMEKYHDVEENNGAVVVRNLEEVNLADRLVQIRLKDLMQRVIEELMEAAHELKNKPWKNTERPTNVLAFQEELIDALHFFVELFITSGVTAKQVYEGYFQKHAINQERQKTGY